jgi:hypothetical protein
MLGTGVDAYKVYHMGTSSKIRLNMNLMEKDLSKVVYGIVTESDVTAEHLVLFPYLPCLSKPDSSMVITTVERYFYGLLGDDAEEASEAFSFLRSAWGTLENTTWGMEMSHVYMGLRLALDTGALMKVIETPNHIYSGFCLIGAGYQLRQYGILHTPMPRSIFGPAFIQTSPHLSSLTTMLRMINYGDDMERDIALQSVDTMQKLGAEIRRLGYNVQHVEALKLHARNLTFPSDIYLPMTSVNVARVLTAIVNLTSEELFPLHHLALLETDRMKRLLSAFGATAPSFLIPGGRSMSLSGSFEFERSVKGKKEVSQTTRVFCMAVPLEKAYIDMARVISEKIVASPIGTPLVNRASSFSVIREYDGAGGASVLAALKNLAGVIMSAPEGTSSGKRGREGEDSVPPVGKKSRYDL